MFYLSRLLKKNKKYIYILILLILIIIFLSIFVKKPLIMFNTSLNSLVNKEIYTHQGNNVVINTYYTTGQLKFKLTAYCIQHFSNQKITWFKHPNVTAFNEKNTPIWKITANQARLDHGKILHLHGHVHMNNLIDSAYFQSIKTNQAIINLITQDIIADKKVIIHGRYFYSVGMKMHANLHTQTIKLIDSTQTYYEIQHIR
ncbi:LPS export ABC transporter periplasmic protein LptC [Blochmannia endosymbiont of Camponotus sp.]|uniref:LPS export ABC transporter periplasmic protein LptC n=1 Tax=Blochmannia endosymbiont of Camponotus sp. TaxID=700220 RepID=UPI002024B609|nr:LPS export ABC transporter periplasmic protein LptC [Blochmannia endosymbiont of Camponotus sp.]URJ29748.1 LPS export ABC transporter periplasmic protein LptC [Blochmannia endosymbiont of Camponotus sp.]